MKRKITMVMALAILALLLTAQTSQSQTWKDADTDSLTVSGTAVDTVFTNFWETVNIKFVGCTGLIRYGTSVNDTTSWSTRKWYSMTPNEILIIRKSRDLGITGLYRLEYKCASGTGALFLTGTRKTNVYDEEE